MTPAVINPPPLIVFGVIHHPQNEDLAVPVVYPGDHPEAVSADVEHDDARAFADGVAEGACAGVVEIGDVIDFAAAPAGG